MATLAIAWILLTPAAVACVVAGSQAANRVVASHLRAALMLGWTGLASIIAGAFVPALLLGAPLAGLAVWSHGPGGAGPDEPPDDPPPPGEDVDWDAFMRDLQRYSDMPRSGADRG